MSLTTAGRACRYKLPDVRQASWCMGDALQVRVEEVPPQPDENRYCKTMSRNNNNNRQRNSRKNEINNNKRISVLAERPRSERTSVRLADRALKKMHDGGKGGCSPNHAAAINQLLHPSSVDGREAVIPAPYRLAELQSNGSVINSVIDVSIPDSGVRFSSEATIPLQLGSAQAHGGLFIVGDGWGDPYNNGGIAVHTLAPGATSLNVIGAAFTSVNTLAFGTPEFSSSDLSVTSQFLQCVGQEIRLVATSESMKDIRGTYTFVQTDAAFASVLTGTFNFSDMKRFGTSESGQLEAVITDPAFYPPPANVPLSKNFLGTSSSRFIGGGATLLPYKMPQWGLLLLVETAVNEIIDFQIEFNYQYMAYGAAIPRKDPINIDLEAWLCAKQCVDKSLGPAHSVQLPPGADSLPARYRREAEEEASKKSANSEPSSVVHSLLKAAEYVPEMIKTVGPLLSAMSG